MKLMYRRFEMLPQLQQMIFYYPTMAKNVIIGILNTGVDPAAVAAADGNGIRLLNLIDCNGARDVYVSTQVQVEWNENEQY